MKTDTYQIITDRICGLLERGTVTVAKTVARFGVIAAQPNQRQTLPAEQPQFVRLLRVIAKPLHYCRTGHLRIGTGHSAGLRACLSYVTCWESMPVSCGMVCA